MNFCATCGRQGADDARFCDGCGTEFHATEMTAAGTPLADEPAAEFTQDTEAAPSPTGQPGSWPAAEPPRWDPPAEAARLETASADWTPGDATRVERQPDATRIDTQGSSPAEPDPFAAWFATDPPPGAAPPRDDPPGAWQQPAGQWQSADTVYAAPGQRAPAYPPPQPPPPYGAQRAPLSGGQPSSGGRRAAFIIVVVLVMLAAGGGAYALVSRSNQHDTAQPPAPTGAASSASAQASASATPSTSPSVSASASASASAGVVSLGPGIASNPAEPAVEKTLTDYFQGINTHNYAEYSSSLDAQQLALQPESEFKSGYSSTSDSGMKLISLTGDGDGGQQATVTFTSHQAAGTGVDGSSCNDWTLNFYLVKSGAGYLKGAAPSGYHPTYSDC
jgi:D-alanyl-D-alanine carboxypeptidase/D-alanyl-D-alanine-endopeptidase (penicillin-binding protein 4)